MKNNRWVLRYLWISRSCLGVCAAALLSAFSVRLQAQVLSVPVVIQEQDQWCWAGVSASTLAYYGTNLPQCVIAEYTRVQSTWHYFGGVNCCTDPNFGCNYWNYAWGYAGSLQDILQHWGINNYGYGSYLSLSEIQTEISALRPFIVRWGWAAGGGHFVVGHGIDGTTMYSMNPWFGEGAKISTYSWLISDGNHTWTHTNILTTTPNPPPQAPTNLGVMPGNTQVLLIWDNNTEPDLLRYRIYGGTSSNPTQQIDSTTGRIKVFTGLTNGTKYYYRIKAVNNAGGASGYSNEVSATPFCCVGATGNTDGSGDDVADISDVFAVVDYLGASIPLSRCQEENDVNKDGPVDISDLFALIDYLGGVAALPLCP